MGGGAFPAPDWDFLNVFFPVRKKGLEMPDTTRTQHVRQKISTHLDARPEWRVSPVQIQDWGPSSVWAEILPSFIETLSDPLF